MKLMFLTLTVAALASTATESMAKSFDRVIAGLHENNKALGNDQFLLNNVILPKCSQREADLINKQLELVRIDNVGNYHRVARVYVNDPDPTLNFVPKQNFQYYDQNEIETNSIYAAYLYNPQTRFDSHFLYPKCFYDGREDCMCHISPTKVQKGYEFGDSLKSHFKQ